MKLRADHMTSDVRRFEELIAEGAQSLREAVSLADGEFLSGMDIGEPAWEECLSLERRRLLKHATDASLALGKIEYDEGDFAGALARAETVFRCDRHREDAHRLVMRALVKLGRRAEALTHYRARSATIAKGVADRRGGDFTIGHWTRSVPFESKTACELFVGGYRKAGLPE